MPKVRGKDHPRYKHGNALWKNRSKEYTIWVCIIARCLNPNNPAFSRYGGRGITICPAWRNSFQQFLDDVGPRPSPDHSIDRYPNNDGNYEPGNVRWATAKEQARNTRHNAFVTHDGVTLCVREWAERVGIKEDTISLRLKKGWPIAEALSRPAHYGNWSRRL